VKLATPEPSFVLLFATVGLLEELQQIPFTVIEAPPSELMTPPEVALVLEIFVIA
jgi:hypothetical protein